MVTMPPLVPTVARPFLSTVATIEWSDDQLTRSEIFCSWPLMVP